MNEHPCRVGEYANAEAAERGVVGAGPAVKALADEWRAQLHPSDQWAARELDAAIAQDADRTSRGGALTEDERIILHRFMHNGWDCTEGGPERCARLATFEQVFTNVLAARATRPAPDDQAEGER